MDFNLGGYLKKFEAFLPPETKIKNAVIAAVQDVVGVTIERKAIRISGANIFITGSGALKSEIAMKQGKVLAKIKELQPDITIQKVS